MFLIHVTDSKAMERIRLEGLRAGTYFASDAFERVAACYAEVIEDEGKQPVVVRVALDDLDADHLVPDWAGLEEPLTHTLGMSEQEVEAAWQECEGTAQDSLSIIGTCRYELAIPVEKLVFPRLVLRFGP